MPLAGLPLQDVPTKITTYSKNYYVQGLAPTTWTTAPVSDTLPQLQVLQLHWEAAQ